MQVSQTPFSHLTQNRQFWLLATSILLLGIILRAWGFQSYGSDDAFWLSWMHASVNGITAPYTEQGYLLPSNYPPVVLILLHGIAKLTKQVGWSDTEAMWAFRAMNSGFDLLTALGIYLLAVKHTGSKWLALVGGSLFWLNPATIFITAFWGQCDSLISLLYTYTLVGLSFKKPWVSGAAIAIGVLTKLQIAVLLPPLVIWQAFALPWRQWAVALASACAAAATVLLPFNRSPESIRVITQEAYGRAIGYYPYLSLNAYNFWWIQTLSSWSASNAHFWTQFYDTTPDYAGFSAKTIGLSLVLTGLLIICSSVYRARRTIAIADIAWLSGLCQLVFFVFSTQMHERYLFAAIAPLLLGALLSPGKALLRWAMVTLVSCACAINLVLVQHPGALLPYLPGISMIIAILLISATLLGVGQSIVLPNRHKYA